MRSKWQLAEKIAADLFEAGYIRVPRRKGEKVADRQQERYLIEVKSSKGKTVRFDLRDWIETREAAFRSGKTPVLVVVSFGHYPPVKLVCFDADCLPQGS